MSDTTFIDMTPFFERHDRRTRRTFVAMLSISLVLAAVMFARDALAGGPSDVAAQLWLLAGSPLTIVLLWIGAAIYGRQRTSLPDGSLPMNADDARNVARVANAGAVFVTGMCVVMVAGQAFWVIGSFGVLQSPDTDRDWLIRAVLLAAGALSIYFGNAWPRIPTPRKPEHKPATRMKYNRFTGWATVIFGALLALAAFLPPSAGILVVMTASISIIVATAAGAVWFHRAMKSGSAS